MKNGERMHVKNAKLIVLPRIEDGIDGTISVVEYLHHIPFLIKRVFYIYNLFNKDAVRGKHAHKELEQAFICARGSCDVELDDGTNKQIIHLNNPHVGIYLGKKLWVTFKTFSPDCLLLVLASDVYRESDYIRDYKEFLRFVHRAGGEK